MRYHVKTINGLSSSFCSHNPPHSPFWGAGQGACDAAARCTAMSSCIFSAYQQRCQQRLLQDPAEQYTTSHSLLAFVDDATTIIPLPTNEDSASNTQTIESNVSLCDNLQASAGGKLNLNKCNVSFFLWDYNQHGIPHLRPLISISTNISVQSSITCKLEPITPLPHD